MFRNCYFITNLKVENFNTENVEDFSNMFNYCLNLTNVDVSKFKFKKVKSLFNMFADCPNLTGTIFFNSVNIANATNCFANTSLQKNVMVKFFDSNNTATQTYNTFNETYPINTPNGTVVGTLTNDNGVISGFTNTSYMTMTKPSDITSDQWEVQIKFTPTEILSSDWDYSLIVLIYTFLVEKLKMNFHLTEQLGILEILLVLH